jgi:hypothetical protein
MSKTYVTMGREPSLTNQLTYILATLAFPFYIDSFKVENKKLAKHLHYR